MRSVVSRIVSLNRGKFISKLVYHCYLKSYIMDWKCTFHSTHLNITQAENFSWLGTVAPCFPLKGKQVSVISKPSDFYEELLKRCQTSKRRITLASLYLGTGCLEQKLVRAIDETLKQNKDKLKLCVLLDYTRSSRGEVNSRTLLLPLLSKYQENCQVALYHTPSLRGFIKKLLPQRWNELVGLQHIKIYLFDDSVIISGANLSNDYFTNRQDRYILVENCIELANFLDGFVKRICDFSLQLNVKDQVDLSVTWKGKEHPYLGSKEKFILSARQHIWNYFSTFIMTTNKNEKANTWIYPFIEMGQLGIHNDSKVTKRLIESAPTGASLGISTGYFNLTQQYSKSIVENSKATFNILMAHPKANGFLGASGPAGGIPSAYTHLAYNFLSLVYKSQQRHRVSLWEYQFPGWTYHAKGLWYYFPKETLPILTLVGSPNFGYRSVYRDLELQAALVTTCPDLREDLNKELTSLREKSSAFPENILFLSDRKPPFWVRFVVAFFRNFF